MKHGRCLAIGLAFTMMALIAMPAQARDRVKASEGKITVPTYQLDPGDLNPKIQELDGYIFYPYTMQDEFTTKCLDQDHRALFLENEYLKVTILPDIGGRIHSVLDKTTNQEVFHLNDSIRPARIALRGAWVSGGIEWNPGPQAHTVISYEPITCSLEPHPDGSASIVISNTLRDSGLRWQVRVTLRPGVAVLDEQIRIANPTDAVRPYFFWNNTSFPNNGNGTRILWPATLICDHFGTKFTRWPISEEGKDMTWLKNYQDTAAMFTVNCIYDFFGAYNVDADRGMVQYGDRRILPGKKCWTWGKSNSGVMRQKFLGEKNTEYIEVQSGPLPTQSDYEFVDPHRAIEWQECWYSVHGLGEGFEYCTRELAVQTQRPTGGDLQVRMLATAKYDGARVRVERDGKALAEQNADLNPKDVCSLSVPGGTGAPVRIVVTAKGGQVLADYTSPLPIPYEKIPQLTRNTSNTIETLYLAGRRFEKNTDRIQARQSYERVLKMEGDHLGAMRGLAGLDIQSARYDDALALLNRALKLEPTDGQTRYMAAVCEFRNGQPDAALKHAFEAIRRPDTVGLGWDIAGRVYLKQGQVQKAIQAFGEARKANPTDIAARDHMLMALMAAGQPAALRDPADEAFRDDPNNLVTWLAQTQVLKVKLARPKLGDNDNEAMDAAAAFAEVGRYAEAESLITTFCGKETKNRLAVYWMAWLAERRGEPEKAEKLRERAAAATTEGVYGSTPMALVVLHEAVAKNPSDARATADLGNMLAGIGRLGDALPLWKKAVELDPGQAVAWRNLGLYEWKWRKDLKAAEKNYAAAAKANPADQTYWRDQAMIMAQDGRTADAIKLLKSMPTFGVKPRGDALLTIVRADLETGDYSDALKIMDSNWFTIGEFQTDSHELFVRALVSRGRLALDKGDYETARVDFERALTYPPNLGIGRNSQPGESQQYYWLGAALEKLGRDKDAQEAWSKGAGMGFTGRGERRDFRAQCRQALDANQAQKGVLVTKN